MDLGGMTGCSFAFPFAFGFGLGFGIRVGQCLLFEPWGTSLHAVILRAFEGRRTFDG